MLVGLYPRFRIGAADSDLRTGGLANDGGGATYCFPISAKGSFDLA